MSKGIKVDQLAAEVEKELHEYSELAASEMKKAVKKAGRTARTEIGAGAPVKTGRYAKSWRSKVTRESASDIQVTVYSPSRYMLAHLLEHGHAKRGGGRVRAFPHIAGAEETSAEQLESDIKRALQKG